MLTQTQDRIIRHSKGAIDIGFYARRAASLRQVARAEILGRISAAVLRALPGLQ